jgi:O-antigen/teichoic acid export membrane protein
MSAVKRNIVSNILAAVWIMALTLVITPMQVRILGIEAYGLIGFIATLQVVFTMFDMGLSSTLTRQIAADRSAGHLDSRVLIRTASTIYWTFACLVGVLLAGSAHLIAQRWFNTSALSTADVTNALYAITVYLAARWPVALYSGILCGLQRMDILNIVKTAAVSLRLLGGMVVLLIWSDLTIFLWWTAMSAIMEVCAYFVVCRKASGIVSWRFGLSLDAIRKVWAFSLSISALSLLALVISQLDRLMLSKMLSLQDLGYYTLAYNTASTVSIGISAVSSAMLPAFAAAFGTGATDGMSRQYDNASRALFFIIGFAVFPLLFFGDAILSMWVGPDAAVGAYRPLVLLAAGFWFSAALSNAYSVTIATGVPNMTLKLSALSAVPYALALYCLVRIDGINGAALAWLLLNLVYFVVLVPAVHRKVLDVSTRDWVFQLMLPFALVGAASFAVPRLVSSYLSELPQVIVECAALLLAMVIYGLAGFRLLGPGMQADIKSLPSILRRRSS